MSTWQDAPDAPGLWWVRREDHRDDVLQVDIGPDGAWVNRGGEGWCGVAEYAGARCNACGGTGIWRVGAAPEQSTRENA